MAGPSWLVDSRRIATKIKSASESSDPKRVQWKSNPTRACPNCDHIIDNSDIAQEWPGLPRGVKFDPSDPEIIWHLLAKVGNGNVKPHPFIDEFIPTVDENDGICYAHPQNLPGVKQDGNVSHFFHRSIKAYNTGTRKRRKINGDDQGDVRWHKTGRTKSVLLDGVQRGKKKIMVLYMSLPGTKKPEKTNWVMHQYHLGTGEDENDGDFVVSKIFYQQSKSDDKAIEHDSPHTTTETITPKVDPVTPKSVIPEPPRTEEHHPVVNPGLETELIFMETSDQNSERGDLDDDVLAEWAMLNAHANQIGEDKSIHTAETHGNQTREYHSDRLEEYNDNHIEEGHDNTIEAEDSKWWEGESQFLIDSQQLVEGLSLCDEFLQSQSSTGDADGECDQRKRKPCLSDYSRIGKEILKKDLEECQKLGPLDPPNVCKETETSIQTDNAQIEAEDPKQDLGSSQNCGLFDPSAIDLDTPPDFRLSQLEFGSQDSFLGWAGGKISD